MAEILEEKSLFPTSEAQNASKSQTGLMLKNLKELEKNNNKKPRNGTFNKKTENKVVQLLSSQNFRVFFHILVRKVNLQVLFKLQSLTLKPFFQVYEI